MGDLLFAASEPGAWYDPSDLSTLFQDTAGTTPVTAVEQAVALMLDKSGRGNHASQATSTKRPKYSRRVNLLTKTEDFSNAQWGKVNSVTVTQNAITVLGRTLDKIVPSAVLGYQVIRQIFAEGISGDVYITSAIFKAGEYEFGTLSDNAFSRFAVSFNLISGAVANQTGSVLSAWMEPLGDGLYRCYVKFTRGANPFYPSIGVSQFAGLAAGGPSFAGDGYSGAYSSAASTIRVTDAHLPYQWVNTATDYDADPAKFPGYLRFDGVDDALATGNIDFTGTDKMTVWAGVTKLSDAAQGLLMGLGIGSAAGSVFLQAPFGAASPSYLFQSTGSTPRWAASTAYPSPSTAVLTGISDISGDHVSLRVNASVVATTTTDQGTGNYGNYPLYIGGQGGTAYYFNGRLYNLIVRGAATPLPQIEAVETIIRQKMRLP